jgi:hypothetical protein
MVVYKVDLKSLPSRLPSIFQEAYVNIALTLFMHRIGRHETS